MATGNSIKYGGNYWIGVILIGYCFSWLSPLLNTVALKSNVIEPFLIAGIFFLSRAKSSVGQTWSSVGSSKRFGLMVIIIAIFFLLGCVNNNSDWATGLGNAYGDFRSNLIFVLVQFWLASKYWKRDERQDFLVHVLAFIAIADTLTLYLRPRMGQVFTKETISIVAPAILTVLMLKRERFMGALFFLLILCLQAVVGFYRNYYIVVILVFIIVLYLLAANYFKPRKATSMATRVKSVVFVLVIIAASGFAWKKVYNYWTSDDSRMIHSINRTTDFVNDAGSENVRINSTLVPITRFDLLLVPKGIGWRNYVDEISKNFEEFGIISTMDSCFFYLAFHYGIILALVVMIYYGKKIAESLIRKKGDEYLFDRFIRICFLVMFGASFFTQGIMFAFVQGAFTYLILLYLVTDPI